MCCSFGKKINPNVHPSADEDFWRHQLKERMKRSVNMTTTVAETLEAIEEFEKCRIAGMSVLAKTKKTKAKGKPSVATITVKPS